MRIVVNDQVHLSDFRSSDKPALIQHLNDQEIYDRTFRIPFPYTDADAEAFLARVAKATEQHGQPTYPGVQKKRVSTFLKHHPLYQRMQVFFSQVVVFLS